MRARLPVLVLCIALACSVSTDAAERGFPLITVYPPEVHKGGPQNFDVAQDARGVLYFGNLHGLMTYDGAWWRMLKLPDDQVALGVATDRHGRIGIGMVNDFGYVAADGSVHSLLAQLPADKREVGDVRSVCTTNDGFLFVAERSLLLWDGRATRVDANGDIEQFITDAAGLPDAVISRAFVDQEGAVWLSMEGPVVRIDVASPVSIFDARRGLKGGTSDVARFHGMLYVASTHGLHS